MARKLDRTHPDYALIEEQVEGIGADMCGRLLAKGLPASSTAIFAGVMEALWDDNENFKVVTIGPCLVGYNVYRPWWCDHHVFVEDFIYRYKPGDFNVTLLGIEELAKAIGCKSVCIGTLAMTREDAYCSLLSRKGYRQVAHQLMKDV